MPLFGPRLSKSPRLGRPSSGEEVLPGERGDLEIVGVRTGDPAKLHDLGADRGTLRTDVRDEHIGDDEESGLVRR